MSYRIFINNINEVNDNVNFISSHYIYLEYIENTINPIHEVELGEWEIIDPLEDVNEVYIDLNEDYLSWWHFASEFALAVSFEHLITARQYFF